jgi:hypothetical protein
MDGTILPGAGSLEAPWSGGWAVPWAARSYLGPAAWRPLGAAGGGRGGGPMGGTILPGAGSLEAPGSGRGAARGRPYGRHHLAAQQLLLQH